MSDKPAYLAEIESNAPAPLEFFEHELIHPDNIALDASYRLPAPLNPAQRWQYRMAIMALRFKLKRAEYGEYDARRHELRDALFSLKERYQGYQAQLTTANDVDRVNIMAELIGIRESVGQIRQEYDQIRTVAAPFDETARQIRVYEARLQQHKRVVELRREDRIQTRNMKKEKRLLIKLLRQTWRARDGCHEKTSGRHGRPIYRVPEIEMADITPTEHWFKVRGSKKGLFGWNYGLPNGVDLETLIEESTLKNYSLTTGREIKAVSNHLGTWIVVNRVDSPGGIARRVNYADIVHEYYPDEQHDKLPIPIGLAEGNRIKWINLGDFPHWLVAGFTGGGKSNFLNVLIATLARYHSPAELRLVFIDLKRNEFTNWEAIPHRLGEIANSMDSAIERLEQMRSLMKDRYKTLDAVRLKKIEQYNAFVAPENRMSRIVIVFDEMAELTGEGKATQRAHQLLKSLTSLGRAAGIHCVICTQRPNVAVIPGNIKDNCAFRVSFRLPSIGGSLTVLDNGMAREIPDIAGRAVAMWSPDPIMVQTPLITLKDEQDAVMAALAYGEAAAIELPQIGEASIVWDVPRMARHIVVGLDGKVSGDAVHRSLKGEVSRQQAYTLVEELMTVVDGNDGIDIDGKRYRIERGRGKARRLVEMEPA